ncbi:DUF1236 domain-containing protein [Solirhodobacter olei]|uniref:DUF1236 domain-containing protein n=1 Tax=Solirhodobacter olei TaxID=2493082 RepID=UPI0013E36E85|nr:DUF1236 domain-containing protein [Solirhodobacter olei]
MPLKMLAAASATALMIAPAAFADVTQATVVTNGAVLAGPGAHYTVMEQVPANSAINVQGCLANGDWCEVETNGQTGWMQSSDLGVTTSTGQVMLSQPTSETQISTVTFDKKKVDRHAAGGAVAGAAVGAAVGGPVGAVVGAAVGAVGGAAATAPDKQVTTYVTANPVNPVTIQGNLHVGMVVPGTITLTPVPSSRYSYIYVNGHPVVVDNQSRTVVRILG